MDSRRIESVQLIRAIASILIMLNHWAFIWEKQTNWNLSLFHMGSFRVPMFFFISGFIIHYIFFQKKQTILKFLKARFFKIYSLYYIFFIPALIMWFYKPELFNAATGHQTDILASFFLIPAKEGYMHIINVTWTLPYILWFYVIFGVFKKFAKDNDDLLIFASLYILSITIFHSFLFSPLFIYFFWGLIFSISLSERNKQIFTIAVVTFIIYLYLLNIIGSSNIINILIAVFLPITIIMLELKEKIRIPKFLSKIGDASFEIYLSHNLIFGAEIIIYKLIGIDNLIYNIIYALSMLISIIIFSIYFHKFSKRFI